VKSGEISSSRILSLLSLVERPATSADFNPYDPHHFWILENSVFQKWIQDPSSWSLCVSRQDASHLDKIALHFVDHLEKYGYFVFYFSCVDAQAQRSGLITFAHSLLHKIVEASEESLKPTLLHTFFQILHNECKLIKDFKFGPRGNSEEYLLQLLCAPLYILMKAVRWTLVEWMNRYGAVVLVVDRLDYVAQENSGIKEVFEIVSVRGMGATAVSALFTGRSNLPFKDTEGFKFIDYSTMRNGWASSKSHLIDMN
jgi:hypothetical protein